MDQGFVLAEFDALDNLALEISDVTIKIKNRFR
jgi:hypothetical protein